jgi:hypothetical protein
MQEFLCKNVIFLLQTQLEAACSQPLLPTIDSDGVFNWNLLSDPVPTTIELEGDELYGDAALYWHRIAISAEGALRCPDKRDVFETSITAFDEGRSHSEAIRELFREYWSVCSEDRNSHIFQWKLYCIFMFSSSMIERLLYDIYIDVCSGKSIVVRCP